MQSKKLILLLGIVSTLFVLPIVVAQPNNPLVCEVSITLNWGPPVIWDGVITGDIEGTFTIYADRSPIFPGETEHFLETWTIVTDEGTISLYQKGVWSFKTFQWKSNGIVVSATGDWIYLVGSNVHVRGTTTPLTSNPVTGLGKFVLSFNK